MKENKIAEQDVKDIKNHAEAIRANLETRDNMLKEIEDIFFMAPSDVPAGEHIKETVAPDGHNAILNANRLVSTKHPIWEIPDEFNSEKMRAMASQLEKWCGATWHAAGRIKRKPIHSESSLMALLYGELHIKVTKTQDLIDNAIDEFYKRRAQRAKSISPVLFDVLNPKSGYAEFDSLGLSAYLSRYETNVGRMKTVYGGLLKDLVEDMKADKELTFNEYWNHQYHMVWFDELGDEPIIAVEHKKPYIPIIVQLFEGTELFTEEEQESRQPFLYPVWKSNIHKRMTLNLTTLYTNIYSMAANPTLLYERNQPDKELHVDFSIPGGVAYIDRGESLGPLVKEPVHSAFLEGMRLAEAKFVESTIYKTAFGEAVGANAAYSMVALLHSAGQLPLSIYKDLLGYAYADAMKLAIEMIKESGSKVLSAAGQDGIIEIDFKDIPETYELTAVVDLDLPQDERQNVIMAVQATYGDDPLISKKYARRKMLGIRQPEEVEREIYHEKMTQTLAMQYLQQQQLRKEAERKAKEETAMAVPDEMMNMLQNRQQAGVPGQPMAGPMMGGGGMGTMPNLSGGQMPSFPEETIE